MSVSTTGIYELEKDEEIKNTQVNHAPLLEPKARSQAGSRDWKNSSGWKKVAIHQALMSRMTMISRRKTDRFLLFRASSNTFLETVADDIIDVHRADGQV